MPKPGGWKRRLKLRIAVGQWQLCENYGPVVMEMASANVKIRHFFGFTSMTERSIGAGPPVVIQLSGWNSRPHNQSNQPWGWHNVERREYSRVRKLNEACENTWTLNCSVGQLTYNYVYICLKCMSQIGGECRGFYNLKIHRKQIGQDSGLWY
jgi:hypothetical protein